MIDAIAIDDEPLALRIIENFCAQSGQINLIKTFTQSNEAHHFLEENKIDLLFLDINMPSISGIDFYKNMEEPPLLIFTTAYSEYAVEGFNLNAVDYLLKPFTYKRFLQAIEKLGTQNVLSKPELPEDTFITIRADYSLFKIYLKEILFIESLDNYVKLHRQDQRPILARMPLKNIIDLLPKTKFIRTHRSYVIPLNKIRSIRNKMVFIDGCFKLQYFSFLPIFLYWQN